jgi:AcrR family transcriptional regulator
MLAGVPRLWNDTIEAHKQTVRDAIVDTAMRLVEHQGLASVTMSQIATGAGIGRATLYKYFPDVESILNAWHERHITAHLSQLSALREEPGTAVERLQAVLRGYALMLHQSGNHADRELATLLHRDEQVAHAQKQLHNLISGLIRDAQREQGIRDDIAPSELATFCLHALTAASRATSKAAVERVVAMALAGLGTPPIAQRSALSLTTLQSR